MNNLVTIEELPEIEGNRLVLKSRRSRYLKPKCLLYPINSTIQGSEKTLERRLYSGKLSNISKSKDTKDMKCGVTTDSFNRDSSLKNNSLSKYKTSIDNKGTNSSTICSYITNSDSKYGKKISNLIMFKDKHEESIKNGMSKCSSEILPIKKQSLYTLSKGETLLFSPNESSFNEDLNNNVNSESTLKLIRQLKNQILINKNNKNKINKDSSKGGYSLNNIDVSNKKEDVSNDKNKKMKVKLLEKMKQNDKNKENLKLKLQRKRENQETIGDKRRIRGKIYNLLSTNTLFVCDDLVEKLNDFNKRALSTFKFKEKTDVTKQNYFNFGKENERDYIMNVERLLENIVSPQKFFEDYFSEEEINKIMQDCQYYFQDERFIKAVNMFKPRKLVERLNEEENINITSKEKEDSSEENEIDKYDHLYAFEKNIEEKAKESNEKRQMLMFNNQTLKLRNLLTSGKEKNGKSAKKSQSYKRLVLSKSEKDLEKMFRKTKRIEEIMENNSKSKSIKDIMERNKDFSKKAIVAQRFKLVEDEKMKMMNEMISQIKLNMFERKMKKNKHNFPEKIN